jgi:hypothetical protein
MNQIDFGKISIINYQEEILEHFLTTRTYLTDGPKIDNLKNGKVNFQRRIYFNIEKKPLLNALEEAHLEIQNINLLEKPEIFTYKHNERDLISMNFAFKKPNEHNVEEFYQIFQKWVLNENGDFLCFELGLVFLPKNNTFKYLKKVDNSIMDIISDFSSYHGGELI